MQEPSGKVSNNKHSSILLGASGEKLAKLFLIKKGFKILQSNFKNKTGEIDIIAKDKDTLVFVEVKTRKSLKYGYPQEAVNSRKIAQIKKVAEYYCLINKLKDIRKRIDVVSILYTGKALPEINIFTDI